MYKKTLAAVAILGAFAGSAMAANVTLYGKVNLGMNYQYAKVGTADATNTFKMNSGDYAGSRFGVKGSEDLGNGLTVGFNLENGFDADTGALGDSDRLFNRESIVYLTGDFGGIYAGRTGTLSSGVGSLSHVWDNASMGTGWGDFSGSQGKFSALSSRSRGDNVIAYQTPDFEGFNAQVAYSFGDNDGEVKHVRDNNRYAGLALNYNAGAFQTNLVVDSLLVKHPAGEKNPKDTLGVTYGASYDLDVAKIYGLVQYAKHEAQIGAYNTKAVEEDKPFQIGLDAESSKAWSGAFGVSAPVAGGTIYSQINYLDGKDKANKIKGWDLAAGYDYALSKRTTVYTFASYGQTQNKVKADDAKTKIKLGEFGFGLSHAF